MKLIHFSDNHSILPPLPKGEYDAVVCSGDFLPNDRWTDRVAERHFQEEWLKEKKKELVEWIGDRHFIFCGGNHDFIDPTILMRKFGIDAVNITNAPYTWKKINFYGFPYIPWTGAFWNYETFPNEMNEKLQPLIGYINDGLVDVIVAHCPPYKYLDKGRDGQYYGSTIIDTALKYKVKKLPKAYLCGHVHQSHGITHYPDNNAEDKMLISNAATTVHVITI